MDERETATNWYFTEEWGFKSRPSTADFSVFAKALLVCCGGDGVIAPEERAYVLGSLAAKGASSALLKELKTYDGHEDLVKLVAQNKKLGGHSRALIFEAIRACSSDGEFSPGERERVVGAAKELGLDASAVTDLEHAYVQERKAREARRKAVFPSGAPY
jgi:hypothetical protein